jgi:uracil phosphoribosyltransferase
MPKTFPEFPNLFVMDHPLIQHKLSMMRDKNTPTILFRQLLKEIALLMGYEITRSLPMTTTPIETPLAKFDAPILEGKKVAVVPILRAGLGMLEGMTKLIPTAEVGFLGMARNEETLQPTTYATRLPEDLSNRQCFVLDPMLATGGSLVAAIDFLFERGAVDVTAVCLLGTPEGLAAVDEATQGRNVTVVLGALDERLNEHGYIVPGLGDAGDRLYGTV